MTRFQDIETVDSSLAGSLQAVNASLATFAASIITVALVVPKSFPLTPLTIFVLA